MIRTRSFRYSRRNSRRQTLAIIHVILRLQRNLEIIVDRRQRRAPVAVELRRTRPHVVPLLGDVPLCRRLRRRLKTRGAHPVHQDPALAGRHHAHLAAVVHLLAVLHLLVARVAVLLVLLDVGRLHGLVLVGRRLHVHGVAVGLEKAAEAASFRHQSLWVS